MLRLSTVPTYSIAYWNRSALSTPPFLCIFARICRTTKKKQKKWIGVPEDRPDGGIKIIHNISNTQLYYREPRTSLKMITSDASSLGSDVCSIQR
jgi:hypothetical protein